MAPEHFRYNGRQDLGGKRKVTLQSNGAKATAELITQAVESNNSHWANALLHELGDITHDGTK